MNPWHEGTPTLPRGMWLVGKIIYGVCGDCGKVIRFNKRLFGSLHVCVDESEKL